MIVTVDRNNPSALFLLRVGIKCKYNGEKALIVYLLCYYLLNSPSCVQYRNIRRLLHSVFLKNQ
jgi:hypothetical protein